jgi:uncharacterized damage-inducible protein DinB
MSEGKRIADQLERAHRGEAWHGPSLREVLKGVTAAAARRRPLPRAHSIWEIVLHIARWQEAPAAALRGVPMPAPPFPEDWPVVTATSAQAWRQALQRLERSHRQLLGAVRRMSDDRLLNEIVPGRDYSFYVLLHGVVQHCLYHAGQIALLKRGVQPRRARG